MAQLEGNCKGYFLFGENPAVGSANARMQRLGMAKLDWLVVRDFSLIESATWWKDGPEIETGELRTEDIGTEVFFLPAAAHTEKDGTSPTPSGCCSGTTRRSSRPATRAATCGSPTTSAAGSGRKLAGSADEMDRPVLDLTWDYPTAGRARRARRRGGAGRDQRLGRRRRAAVLLRPAEATTAPPPAAAGSTAASTPTASTRPPAASQASEQNWVATEWGWAWPANRRILYNRASADPDGKPWSERKALVWWDEEQGKWTGHDIADFEADQAAALPAAGRTPPAPRRSPAPTRSSCRPTARRGCSRPAGLADGPLPTHYEPQDSPFRNLLYRQQRNPVRGDPPSIRRTATTPAATSPGAEVFPYVATTYRLTEHHTAGGMTRWAALPGRAAARVLLRGLAGAGRRARARARGLGDDRHRARRRSRPGCW